MVDLRKILHLDKEQVKVENVIVAEHEEGKLTKSQVLNWVNRQKHQLGFGYGHWRRVSKDDLVILELMEKIGQVFFDGSRANYRLSDAFWTCQGCVNFIPRRSAMELNHCKFTKGALPQMMSPKKGEMCSGFMNKSVNSIVGEVE